MKSIGYALLLLGAILGPGYLAWANKWSGEEIARTTALVRDAGAARVGGVGMAVTGGGRWGEPLDVTLDPGMGAITVAGEAEATLSSRRTRAFSAVVTASADGEMLWTDTVTFADRLDADEDANVVQRTITRPVRTFRVEERGPVRLSVGPGREHELPVSRLSLTVRSGVHDPLPHVYGPGLGVFLLGFAALFLSERSGKADSRSG